MGKEYSGDITGDGPADAVIVERDADSGDTPFVISTNLLGARGHVYAPTPGLYEAELGTMEQTDGGAEQTAYYARYFDTHEQRGAGSDDTPFMISANLLDAREHVYASTPGLYEAELDAMEQADGDAEQTAHYAHDFDTHERTYISSPGLYEAEIDIMRDEVSLIVCSQYHHLVHVPYWEHRLPPALRHTDDEIAHYVILRENLTPNSLLTLISSARASQPCSCVLGFLFGD